MTTEVQIKRSSLYLSHLKKIISCVASKLGMSAKKIEDTESAVSETCLNSINNISDYCGGKLWIKLSTDDASMTVDITDPYMDFEAVCSPGNATYDSYARGLDHVKLLVDNMEFIRESEGVTIRLTQYARHDENSFVTMVPQLSVLEPANLHS